MPAAHARIFLLLRAAQAALQASLPAFNGGGSTGNASVPLVPLSFVNGAAVVARSATDGGPRRLRAGTPVPLMAGCMVAWTGWQHAAQHDVSMLLHDRNAPCGSCPAPAHAHARAVHGDPAAGDGMREISLTDSDGSYRNLVRPAGKLHTIAGRGGQLLRPRPEHTLDCITTGHSPGKAL